MAKRLTGRTAAVFLLVMLCLGQLLCLGELPALAGSVQLTEGQLKAAYIFNFIQFVDWPTSAFAAANAPIVITVIGKSSYPDAFGALVQRTARKRHVVVRHVANAAEIGETHILFIGTSEKAQLPKILGAVKGSPVLTVSDISHFAGAGGIIGLITLEDRIGFEINLKAARKVDLKLSAHLLKLATVVLE